MFINQYVTAIKTDSGRKYATIKQTRDEALEAISRAERLHGKGCGEVIPLVGSDFKNPVVEQAGGLKQKVKVKIFGAGVATGGLIAAGVVGYFLYKKIKKAKKEAEKEKRDIDIEFEEVK